jgi:hypothetical protein
LLLFDLDEESMATIQVAIVAAPAAARAQISSKASEQAALLIFRASTA